MIYCDRLFKLENLNMGHLIRNLRTIYFEKLQQYLMGFQSGR